MTTGRFIPLSLIIVTVAGSALFFQNCSHSVGSDANLGKGGEAGIFGKSPPIAPSTSSSTFSFKIQGVMYKVSAPAVGAHQYQVNWTPTATFKNTSGQPLVVKALDFTIRARSGLGLAYSDVCAVITTGQDVTIANGIEQLCFSETKTRTAADWDHPTVHIDFPGQGLWFPPDQIFICGAQGISDASENPPNYAADLECAATLAYADPTSPQPPVQSLRAPYIDQRFLGTRSSLTPHTNPTAVARPVLGVWMYLSTFVDSITDCLATASGTSGWGQQCETYKTLTTPHPVPLAMQAPGYAFKPGDKLAAECTIQSGDNSLSSICASYFFVAVPVQNGVFAPLTKNATIAPLDAQRFCASSGDDLFALTDGSGTAACLKNLALP